MGFSTSSRTHARLGTGAPKRPLEDIEPPWNNPMLKDVVAVKPLDGYKLHLTFEDEAEGIVDVAPIG